MPGSPGRSASIAYDADEAPSGQIRDLLTRSNHVEVGPEKKSLDPDPSDRSHQGGYRRGVFLGCGTRVASQATDIKKK